MPEKNYRRKKVSISRILVYTALSVISIVYLYPLLWLVISSFKTDRELFSNPWSLSTAIQLGNYATAWSAGKIGRSFLNSALVALVSVGLTIVTASMSAFAIKRFKWKGSALVMGLFLIGVFIPIHSTLIPLFMAFNKIRLINNYLSLILPYVAFALPTSIFILGGFMSAFPGEIEEAAVMDGCKMSGVFWKIIFPLSKTPIATISIFNFVNCWNELMFAMIFLPDVNKMTLPVSLTRFRGQYSTNWSIQLAAIVIMVVPALIAYIFLNDKIMKSLTVGAVKG
jgi:raffinose/stachyose/melibiose transport system permease protein